MVMMKGFALSKFDLFLFNYVCVVLEAAGVVGPFIFYKTILFSFPRGVVLSVRWCYQIFVRFAMCIINEISFAQNIHPSVLSGVGC
jgi:hypothetical protein